MAYDRPALPTEIAQAIQRERKCNAVPKDQRDRAWCQEFFHLREARIWQAYKWVAPQFGELYSSLLDDIVRLVRDGAGTGDRLQRDGLTASGKMRLITLRDNCQAILEELQSPLFRCDEIEIDLTSIEYVAISPTQWPEFMDDIAALQKAIIDALAKPDGDAGGRIYAVAVALGRTLEPTEPVQSGLPQATIRKIMLREIECIRSGAKNPEDLTTLEGSDSEVGGVKSSDDSGEAVDYTSEADDSERWMRFIDAEQMTEINRGQFKRAADAGEIPDNGEVGRKRRIDRAAVTRWVETYRKKQTGAD
jgi:hypothetical protein